ncbi:MAG: SlyX family protein [Telluria sp.]
MEPDDRFIRLEIKIAEQEHLLESLNQTVYEQARRIRALEDMLAELATRVRDRLPAAANEKPPHY